MLSLFLTLFLGIVLLSEMQIEAFRTSARYLEDALAASNLAAAVIDIEEYGISNAVQIADVEESYTRFCHAIKENLQLDENWEGNNRHLISGEVKVESYVVYNVNDEEVDVYAVDNGNVTQWQGILGAVSAPNGLTIEHTSIYSEISFPVEGSFGIRVNAHMGKLVDVVSVADS